MLMTRRDLLRLSAAAALASVGPGPAVAAAHTRRGRLSWIPERGCRIALSVGMRPYNGELEKIREGAPNFQPFCSREFFKIGTDPKLVVRRANERAAVGVKYTIVNIAGSDVPFQHIIDGGIDRWVKNVAAAMRDAGRKALVLYFHEPHAHVNDPRYTTGLSYRRACRMYVGATRRIIEKWRSVNADSAFVYQATEYRMSLGQGPDCYAGRDWIDLVGYTGANGNTPQNPWKSPRQRLDMARGFIKSTGKPGMVLAGGCAEDPAWSSRKVGFYDQITEAMKSMPEMKLYVMPSTFFADTGSAQWIDSSPRALAKIQGLTKRRYHNPTC